MSNTSDRSDRLLGVFYPYIPVDHMFFQVDRNHKPVGALMCQHRDVEKAWHGLTQGLTWLEPRTQGTQRWWRWGWAGPCQSGSKQRTEMQMMRIGGMRCSWQFHPKGLLWQLAIFDNHHVTSCLYSEFSVQDGSGDHYYHLRSPGACGWKQIQI